MNKITFIKAEFRNFLSFGNNWNTINILPGMNLIQGINVDTEKSNGSGKSSTMEVIPFALFGQTIKPLKKDEIVNWFNGSNCEVKLYVDINGDEFMFHRGIKPNKFIVKRNGEEIPRLADVRTYQAEIEDAIIGMDFKTFRNLIYFSPNNQVSILSAKKDVKRQFLVSLFDLSVYSEMLKKVNEKSKKLVTVRDLADNDRDHYTTQISDLEFDLVNFVIPDTKEYKMDLNKQTLLLEGLEELDVVFDEDKYKRVEGYLTTFKEDLVGFESQHKISQVESKNAKEKIVGLDKRVTESTDIRGEIERKITEITILEPEEELKTVSALNDKVKEELSIHKDELIFIKDSIASIETSQGIKDAQIHFTNGQIDEVLNQSKLDEVDCPLCKQKVDQDKLKIWKDQEINGHMAVLKLYAEEDQTYTEELKRLEGDKQEVTDTIKDKLTKSKEYVNEMNGHIDMIGEVNKLRSNLDMLPDVDELKKELQTQRDLELWHDNNIKTLTHKVTMTETDIDLKSTILEGLDKDKIAFEKHEQRVKEVKQTVEQYTTKLVEFEVIIVKQEKLIKEKKNKVDELMGSIRSIEKKRVGTNRLLDHLDYMKVSLKDENVKQYAISTFLPYLNQRANHYLSESGFPYAVSIDGWLDVTIRGLGVDDVSYSSLSGGESKAIDMAIQLSCNDIAELQAKVILNLSIYDEILDSSLDADGVTALMNIVSTRQEKNNSAVYVITHRDEIRDLEFDNILLIEKENGFSAISDDNI